MPKLIVLMAFDRDPETGEVRPAFEPRECQSEDQAIYRAKLASTQHDAVIAWAREASPDVGDYGEPVELFRSGEVPDMD